MSLLEYAYKFMELSYFAPAFIEDEKLKMNRFDARFNSNLKERKLARQYIYYEDVYNIVVNLERAMKEKNE